MNLWNIGFGFLILGVAIPIAYGLYEFVLASIPWYWRLSVVSFLAGLTLLIVSAISERARSEPPEQKV